MAAGIPALKVSRDSAVVSSSGSWFHSLMLDGKRDSFYVLDLLYGTLYLHWWSLVAAPSSWNCAFRMHGTAILVRTSRPASSSGQSRTSTARKKTVWNLSSQCTKDFNFCVAQNEPQ